MPNLKVNELRKYSQKKLRDTLYELRAELIRLKTNAQRGLAQKELGKIRRTRRNIARILTVMREKGVKE
jgi:ribosomal protein L29